MPLKVIQNTQINQTPFTLLHSNEVTYPISPLASVKLITPTDGKSFLSIRVTLYIDSTVTESPRVQPNPAVIDNSLQLYFDYNYSEEIPKSLNAWYLELEYTSPTVKKITSITTFLKDIDPETSTGTKIIIA
ncbi:MAG: hypothetical protein PHC28_16580 [Flavobacterium sp.]|uniref:hypothetical protein n=1 Tax=Flavobacterium sp. TaxID=239 RepID=UPI00262EA2CF|nr:hypothetical protein [Flavobacterium sp.]MDD5152069.1 hypothetical protein [Flavobacterium sp.]